MNNEIFYLDNPLFEVYSDYYFISKKFSKEYRYTNENKLTNHKNKK